MHAKDELSASSSAGINLPRDVANPTSIGSPAIPFGAWDQAGLDVNDGSS